jgi:hypothetical protein
MYNPNYNPNLPLIRGHKGDFEVIIDTGEVINITRNPRLACYLARSLDLPMPRANCLVELVHSACRGSVRALELLARMDWQIIQLDADTLPFTV